MIYNWIPTEVQEKSSDRKLNVDTWGQSQESATCFWLQSPIIFAIWCVVTLNQEELLIEMMLP